MGEDQGKHTEFQQAAKSIAGGMEMSSMVPGEVPSHWRVYFGVDDVDKAFKTAVDGGGTEILAPQDYSDGRTRSCRTRQARCSV